MQFFITTKQALKTLALEDTVHSYTGKNGCMCGCNGEYNPGEAARMGAIEKLLKRKNVRLQTWEKHPGYEDAGCIYWEGERKREVLYLNTTGVEKLKPLCTEVAAD